MHSRFSGGIHPQHKLLNFENTFLLLAISLPLSSTLLFLNHMKEDFPGTALSYNLIPERSKRTVA